MDKLSTRDAMIVRCIMSKQDYENKQPDNSEIRGMLAVLDVTTNEGWQRFCEVIEAKPEWMAQVIQTSTEDEIPEAVDLTALDISTRAMNALHSAGIKTPDDIIELLQSDGKKGLKEIKGIGHNSVEEIIDALMEAGYEIPSLPFDDEPPQKPDDDQLADLVIEQIEDDHRFFYGAFHTYCDGLWTEQKGIYQHVMKVLRANRFKGIRPSRARYTSVEFFVERGLELPDDSVVDDYPHLFNVQNGLFNLDTMTLEPHSKDIFFTAQAGFDYDPKAKANTFRKWLQDMFVKPDGTTDYDLILLVQEIMGYCLTADTSHRASFWFVGASGTGKSTFVNLMVSMMKSYHTTIDLNQLATNRFLLSRVAGKRLVTSIEASAGVRLDDGIYKTLVSDDVVLADVKNREPIEFVPQCKIVWAMNNLPYVGDRSGAVDSRVIIVPMSRQIPREQWDLELDNKLLAELPGIFNWALEGLKRLRSQGAFTKALQAELLGDEYRKMQDIYHAFLHDDEWCVLDDDSLTEPTPLFKAFSGWCSEAGIKHYASRISISREWERLGLGKKLTNNRRYYSGVQLTQKAKSYFV